MTPEERNLVSELFDRLAALEDAQRDPDAERAIRDGLRQAPNAPYALVQTTLVQDEALKRADARIRELEAELGIGAPPPSSGGFLGSMRDTLMGRPDAPRAGSVPTIRPAGSSMSPPTGAPMGAPVGAPPGYATGAQPMGAAPGGAGGSFLGTAAAAAAGMIGGSLLLSGIRSMTGGTPHAAGAFGTTPAAAASTDQASPWGSAAGGNLSKEAGLDDIGRSPGGRDDGGAGRGQGLLDSNTTTDETQSAANEDTEDTDSADDFEDDDGGGDDGEE